MSAHPTAVVVGGSLAGLTAALSLSRVGVDVTVLERGGSVRSRGAGLLISDRLVERVTGWDGSNGRRVPTSLHAGFHSWSAIFAALSAAAEHDPGVSIEYEARVVAVEQDAHAAWATTDDGRVFPAEVVVGADGHRSVVRRAVAPAHPDAAFAGYVVWLASIDEQALPASIRGDRRFDSGIFLGGDTVLAAGPFPGPDGSTAPGYRTIGWAMYDSAHNDFLRRNGNVRGSLVHHSVSANEITTQLASELTQEISARWPSPWKDAMLASLRAGLVIGTPITEYVPDRLVNGRLAIVGDAAHVATPMTGRGYTEALEDAEALAQAIERANTDDPGRHAVEALRRYEHQRLRRARDTVTAGRTFSRGFGHAA